MPPCRFIAVMQQCWEGDPDKETNILSASDYHWYNNNSNGWLHGTISILIILIEISD